MNRDHTPTDPNERPHRRDDGESLDVLGPLLSAAIFAYFGFLSGLATDDGAGNTVPLYFAAVWGMRIASILFLASATVAMLGVGGASLTAGGLSAIATLILAAITVWSMVDPTYDIAVNHLIMIICVLWNGYSAFRALRSDLR